MKGALVLGSSLLIAVLGGCAHSVVGTWKARGTNAQAPFTFGSVSFVGDKTFTAEARYSGDVRVQSGTWSTKGDRLMLNADQTERQYTFSVRGGSLVVTDPKTGHSITLDRIAR